LPTAEIFGFSDRTPVGCGFPLALAHHRPTLWSISLPTHSCRRLAITG